MKLELFPEIISKCPAGVWHLCILPGLSASHCFGNVSALGLQKWQKMSWDLNQSTVNSEIEIAPLVLFSSCILNIEIKKLFKIYTAYVDGSFWLCILTMYWFLIKAWHCYNGHFVFNLIKQFLSLVWRLFSYELEVKEKGTLSAWRCYF